MIKRRNPIELVFVTLVLSIQLCLILMQNAFAQAPDWLLDNAPQAVDISLSHDGGSWLVGLDGYPYKWDSANSQWKRFGNIGQLSRIDANNGYVAAIATNGKVYLSLSNTAVWTDLNITASDISLGGGFIWLAGANNSEYFDSVLSGQLRERMISDGELSQAISWQIIEGQLERLDSDGNATLWGLDANNQLFYFADAQWRQTPLSPSGIDVGAGKNGSVYVVISPEDATLGGGKISRRNPITGIWSSVVGRALNISAGENDVAWGVNSFNWLISSTLTPIRTITTDDNNGEEQYTLQMILGDNYELPETLADIPVSDISNSNGVTVGRTMLNGLPTKLAIYTPSNTNIPNLLFGHDTFSIADYVPDLQDSGVSDLGRILNAVIMWVPNENIELLPAQSAADTLASYFQNEKLKTHLPLTSLELIGELDLQAIPEGSSLANLFELSDLILTIETGLPNTLFTNVTYSESPAAPIVSDSERTVDDLVRLYGEEIKQPITLYASAQALENKKIGPAVISNAEWQLSLDDNVSLSFISALTFPVEGSNESIVSDSIVRYQHAEKSLVITGRVNANEVAKVASHNAVAIADLDINGEYFFESADQTESNFSLDGFGQFKSAQDLERQIKLRVELALAKNNSTVIPSLYLETGLTLADVFGEQIPVLGNIELRDITLSSDLLMGSVKINGKNVKVARFANDSLSSPLVALMHEDLAIKTYVPELNDTPFAGLLFSQSVVFGRQGNDDGEVFETREDLPDILRPYLQSNFDLFPLTIEDGISAIAFHDPNSENKATEETQEALSTLGVPEQGYLARAYFDADMLLQAIYEETNQPEDNASSDTEIGASANKAENLGDVLAALPKFDFEIEFQVSNVEIPRLDSVLSLSNSAINIQRSGENFRARLITGMEVSLPVEEDPGIALAMLGAIELGWDEEALSVSIAGSTIVDRNSARELGLSALASLPEADATPDFDPQLQAGWQNVFGIPQFTLLQTAFTTEFSIAADSNLNTPPEVLTSKFFGVGYIGKQAVSADGAVTLSLNANQDGYDFEDAYFSVPGPVFISKLPGLEKVPKASEMSLRDMYISTQAFYGNLDWESENSGGAFYLVTPESETSVVKSTVENTNQESPPTSESPIQGTAFELYARLDQFNLSMLETSVDKIDGLVEVAGIPSSIWEQQLGPVVIALSNLERRDFTLNEQQPTMLSRLFTGTPDSAIPSQKLSVLDLNESAVLAKGMTVFSMFDPNSTLSADISAIFDTIGLTAPISMIGAIEQHDNGNYEARFTAATEVIVPNSTIDVLGIKPIFGPSKLLISTFDNGEFGLETSAKITLGSEEIEMFGYRKFANDSEGNIVDDDWQFRAPGPVLVGGLPGLGELPVLKQWELSNLVFEPNSITAQMSWPEQGTGGIIYLQQDFAGNMQLSGRVDYLTPSMLYTDLAKSHIDQQLSPAFVAYQPKTPSNILPINADLPAPLQRMLLGDSQSIREYQQQALLPLDANLKVVKGLTLLGLSDVDTLKESDLLAPIFEVVAITDSSLLMSGTFEIASDDKLISEAEFTLGALEIPNIPSTSITFTSAAINLNNIENNVATISSFATVTPPLPVDLSLPMKGSISFEDNQDGTLISYDLMVIDNAETDYKISSEGIWKNPPLIPNLEVSDLGFTGEILVSASNNVENTYTCSLVGKSKVDKVEAKIAVDLCGGRELSMALEDPNYDPIIYVEDEVRFSTLLRKATGFIDNYTGSGSKEDQELALEQLLNTVGDVAMSEILISNKAMAGNIDLNIANTTSLVGSAAVAFDGDQFALFIRNNQPLSIGNMLTEPLPPLDQITLPQGVFAISTQQDDDFDLGDLPIKVFDDIFGGLISPEKGKKLRVTDGITLLSKSNTDELPLGIKQAVQTFGISGDFIIGGGLGGVFGGPPSINLYVALGEVDAPLPDFAGEIIEIKDADVELQMTNLGPGQETEVTLSTEATLKMPRIDKPGIRESIDTTIGVGYAMGGDTAGSLSIQAMVEGEWLNPMGFQDFALTNTSVSIGVAGTGTTVAINSEEAVFKDKRFVFDLDTAWVGGAPSQLSVQFAKSPSMEGDLIISPIIQAEIVNSIFQVALKSGSSLAENIFSVLESETFQIPGPIGQGSNTILNSVDALVSLSNKIGRTSDSMVNAFKHSPLGMIGIKNPNIYFVTPGNSLPAREGVERPPLGLGLIAFGDMVLHAGNINAELASGEYRINLKDGYLISGEITPPAPFSDSFLSVTGRQSILTFSPAALRLAGNLQLPDSLLSGFPVLAEGHFDFERSDFSADTEVNAAIKIGGGLIEREAYFKISGSQLQVYSSPKGCIDVPIALDGSFNVTKASDASKILTVSEFQLPSAADLLTCPESMLEIWQDFRDNPTATPMLAAGAVLQASEMLLDQLPDNEATRQLYQGVAAVEEALGITANAIENVNDTANDVINSIPGTGYLGDGLDQVADFAGDIPGLDLANQIAAQAAAEAIQAASQLAGSALALLGGDPSAFASGLGAAALDQFANVANFADAGIGALSNWFGSGRNYCNVLIENMRDDNIAPESSLRAKALWTPFAEIWKGSAEAKQIQDLDISVRNRMRSDLEALYYASEPWNQVALRIDSELTQAYVRGYHEANVNGLPFTTNTLYTNTWPLVSELIKRENKLRKRAHIHALSVEETLARLKSWAEISNFDPNADYPGFRCEKQRAVVDSMQAAVALGIQVTHNNSIATDYLTYNQLHGALNSVGTIASNMRTANANSIQQLVTLQTEAITRNIRYLADLKGKMELSLRMLEAKAETDEASLQQITEKVSEAETAIETFFNESVKVVSEGSAMHPDIDVIGLVGNASKKVEEAYLAGITALLNRLNQPWSSTTEMTIMVLPYSDKCLRSFYRSDNKNPLFVSDCHEGLQQVLQDVESGVATNLNAGSQLLDTIRINAVTYEQRIVEDLRYQFWLWEPEDEDGITRVATAQSMQSPLATYCLGVPHAFAPPVDDPVVEATPCISKDTSQHWQKLEDEGGPSYFRLKSTDTGLCATWNGLNGVNALVLKECNESNKARQVMTAGWPVRVAEHEPKLLSENNRTIYAWKNFDNSRCIQRIPSNSNNFEVAATSCNSLKTNLPAAASLGFMSQKNSANQWQFTYQKNGQEKCLVSTNIRVNYFNYTAREGDRIIGLGSCDIEESYFNIDKSNIVGESTQRKYKIKTAFGEELCMEVNQPTYGSMAYLHEIPLRLSQCSESRNDRQLFYPIEILPTGPEPEVSNSTLSGEVVVKIGDQGDQIGAGYTAVVLMQGTQTRYVVASDQYGEFTFRGILPGNYTLKPIFDWKVKATSNSRISVSVPANTNVIGKTVEVSSIFRILGNIRIQDENGVRGLANHKVSIRISETSSISVLSDETGSYRFVDLPEGEYTIEVDSVGYDVIRPNAKEIRVEIEGKNSLQNNFRITPKN
ncbi:tectonin domain-containing protein [Alteromonas sp. W364]|uniref:tectonin domain-containing protein n=1 Tax=Alteromonas sp. W364 TaxID=3075610 RepID=UPI002888C571|nr:tectonin domain-containing protein [Alteromonas sp. W364]MDT0627766.1 tectonin domain-containing protein [Alteromonas sp. W364]